MARYAAADDPSALYVWDERLQKAYLEDIAHVEVLLRNFVAERLAIDRERATGEREWYDHPERYNTSLSFLRSVEKAKSRLQNEGKGISYDRVIATGQRGRSPLSARKVRNGSKRLARAHIHTGQRNPTATRWRLPTSTKRGQRGRR